jgi:hypothetical protein
VFALTGLGEAEADCSRNKARRRVVPGYGEEAQRSAGGNPAGIDKPGQGEYALAMRIGKAKAVTATARKIAVLFYNTLRYGMTYADPGATYYEQQYRQRVLKNLMRRADSLGYCLREKPSPTEGVS